MRLILAILAFCFIPQTIVVKNQSHCEVLVTVIQGHRPIADLRLQAGRTWRLELELDPLQRISYRVTSDRCPWAGYTTYAKWPLSNVSELIVKDQ